MAERDCELLERLTEREREVLALLAAGKTNGEIADALGISFLTARNHVAMILSKLEVSSRGQAGAWWRRRPEGAGTGVRGGWRRLVRGLTPGFALGGLGKALAGTTAVVAGGTAVAATVMLGVALNEGRPVSLDLVNEDGTLNAAPGDAGNPDEETVAQLYDWLRTCVEEGREGEMPAVVKRTVYTNAPDEDIEITHAQGDAYVLCADEAARVTGLSAPPPVVRDSVTDGVPSGPLAGLVRPPEEVMPMSPDEVDRYIEGAGLTRDDLSAEHLDALADGIVTWEEHEAAIERYMECGLQAGFSARPFPGEGLRPTSPGMQIPGNVYGVPNGDAFHEDKAKLDACRMRELETADSLWSRQQDSQDAADTPAIYGFMRECLAEGRRVRLGTYGGGGYFMGMDMDVEEPIVVKPGQMRVYEACALELRAGTGWIAPLPEVAPSDGLADAEIVKAGLVGLEIDPGQRAILDDGIVTDAEHEEAWQHFYACAGPQVPTLELVAGEGKRPTRAAYTGPAGEGPDDWRARFDRDQIVLDCADQHVMLANQVWALQRPAPTAEETAQFEAAMGQCLAEGRTVDPEVLTRDVVLGTPGIALEPVEIGSEGELGTYFMCALEIEAETGLRAQGPVIVAE